MSTRDDSEIHTKVDDEGLTQASTRGEAVDRRPHRDSLPLLCDWLYQKTVENGHTRKQAADAIGVTHGYIAQLGNGHRNVNTISEEFVRGCARYLGVPPIVIKLAAGRITLEDWDLVDSGGSSALSRAMARLHAHPCAKTFSVADTAQMPEEVQRSLVEAFSASVGINFFEGKDMPSYLDELRVPAQRVASACANRPRRVPKSKH